MYGGMPYRKAGHPFDGFRLSCTIICFGRVVGALLACGRRLLFLPCLARSPPLRSPVSLAFSFAPAAHARPCALTLIPSGFVLLCGHTRPATLLIAPAPSHCGLRFAPPTQRMQASGVVSDGRASRVRQACNIRALKKRIPKTKKS